MTETRFLLCIFALAALLSCGGHGDEAPAPVAAATPSEAVDTAYARLIRGEYQEYLNCVASMDSVPERYRAALVNTLKQWAANEEKERRGVARAEAISESVNPDGDYATVRVDVTYGDSTREEIVVPAVRVEGKWRLK